MFKRRGEKGIGLVVGVVGEGEAKSLDGIEPISLLEVLEVNNPPTI